MENNQWSVCTSKDACEVREGARGVLGRAEGTGWGKSGEVRSAQMFFHAEWARFWGQGWQI